MAKLDKSMSCLFFAKYSRHVLFDSIYSWSRMVGRLQLKGKGECLTSIGSNVLSGVDYC